MRKTDVRRMMRVVVGEPYVVQLARPRHHLHISEIASGRQGRHCLHLCPHVLPAAPALHLHMLMQGTAQAKASIPSRAAQPLSSPRDGAPMEFSVSLFSLQLYPASALAMPLALLPFVMSCHGLSYTV